MLSIKQNFLETLKADGHPDRLVNAYEATVPVMIDPVQKYTRGNRKKGATTKDRWGTEIAWPEDQMFAMPHITADNKVCPDITEWRNYVVVPDLVANCSNPADWEPALEAAAKIRQDDKLVMSFMGTGVFEELHHLMGFEDTLMNLLLEPDDMLELAEAVGEYRFQYTKLLVDYLKPDVIISHDDWGSKNSLFMSPEVWREIIKPQYVKMYGYMKEHGVIIMHHADSYCEPIVEDMVELGIDIWQGVLPTNNIPAIQKKLNGRMALMGGIDSVIDRAGVSEEEVRTEVRRACREYGPGGNFIPSLTYGLPGAMFKELDPIIYDEIERYNAETYSL
ncbi:MAG: uroporphyrinogen decarboxylase family protein [Lachnospiraceae bacterium]|nr:uroporphyrinogen decarboxylase family protein [Lachnospiraceae bacterium]